MSTAPDTEIHLVTGLARFLRSLRIHPRRLVLETPGVEASVPMLRGVWGAALHGLDPGAYREVFEGGGRPAYILRPASPDPLESPALDWILIGERALRHDRALLRAWDVASGMGLGARRERFFVRKTRDLGGDGPWPLSNAVWPLDGNPAVTPCRLIFDAPLRIRRDSRLIENPAFADIALAALRRIRSLVSDAVDQGSIEAVHEALRAVPSEPRGWQRLDLHRYSARQGREVDQWGVIGALDLPEGPGPSWPLLAACQWIHVGSGTVMGLGQMRIEPLSHSQR